MVFNSIFQKNHVWYLCRLSNISSNEIGYHKGLKKLKFLIVLFFILFSFSGLAKTQIVPLENVPVYKGSYALIIGASSYSNGFQKIYGVRDDVASIETILKLYDFKTFVVMDPDHVKLRQAFDGFVDKFGMDPENRLIIYYSGHGKRLFTKEDEEEKQENDKVDHFIVPVNAPNPDIDRIGFLKNAMHLNRLLYYSEIIKSKHVLFVLDFCFSGGIFKIEKSGTPKRIMENAKKAVRQFITAGRHDETVPDNGSFREAFIAALQGEGDLNSDAYLTGSEIGQYIQNRITTEDQSPQYGKVNIKELSQGEFVIALSPGIGENFVEKMQQYKKDSEIVDKKFPYKIMALAGIGISAYGMKTSYDHFQDLTNKNEALEEDYKHALSEAEKEKILNKHNANKEEATDVKNRFNLFGLIFTASVAWEIYLAASTPSKKPRDDTWKLELAYENNRQIVRFTKKF